MLRNDRPAFSARASSLRSTSLPERQDASHHNWRSRPDSHAENITLPVNDTGDDETCDEDDDSSFELREIVNDDGAERQRPIALVNESPFKTRRKTPHFQPRQPRPFGMDGHRLHFFEESRLNSSKQDGVSPRAQRLQPSASRYQPPADVRNVPHGDPLLLHPASNGATYSSCHQPQYVQDLVRRHPRMQALGLQWQNLAGLHLDAMSMVGAVFLLEHRIC